MDLKRLSPCLAVLGSVVALWAAIGPRGQSSPPIAPRPAKPLSETGLSGTASCSARGCHGGVVDKTGARIEQDEYTLWLTQDKHAQAYDVLFGVRSQDIARKLGSAAAHEDTRCLACHVTPAAAAASSPLAKEERLSGVGCEACHGYAGNWLDEHTKIGWAGMKTNEKRALGMVPPAEIKDFARQCTGCHIGTPAQGSAAPLRDMNHDLIAAGHPRLNFELGVFLANLPRHWSSQIVAGRPPDYEAKAWELGQLVSAQASLELLADRAAAADKGRPWPEFSEYDCYSCHHDLTQPGWRQAASRYQSRKPGSLPCADWYFSMPRLLAAGNPDAPADLIPALDALSTRLQKAYPDPNKTSGEAADTALKFNQWLERSRAGDHPERVEKLDKLLRDHAGPFSSWDQAEQTYLALTALTEAHRDPAAVKLLDDMGRLLAFPQEPVSYASPKKFRPDNPELGKRVEMLRALFRKAP